MYSSQIEHETGELIANYMKFRGELIILFIYYRLQCQITSLISDIKSFFEDTFLLAFFKFTVRAFVVIFKSYSILLLFLESFIHSRVGR